MGKSGQIEIVRMRLGGRNSALSESGQGRRGRRCLRGLGQDQVKVFLKT